MRSCKTTRPDLFLPAPAAPTEQKATAVPGAQQNFGTPNSSSDARGDAQVSPPHIIYACEKTGLLLMKDAPASPSDRKVWNDAIDDYFAIETAQKNNPDRPDPKHWKTEIPELLASPFSRHDLAKVVACQRALGPFEKGMNVVARIELAAALMATACEHAFATAKVIKGASDGAERYAMA